MVFGKYVTATDDGKNLMMTNTINKPDSICKKQERIWIEVTRQMASDLENMFRRLGEIKLKKR